MDNGDTVFLSQQSYYMFRVVGNGGFAAKCYANNGVAGKWSGMIVNKFFVYL